MDVKLSNGNEPASQFFKNSIKNEEKFRLIYSEWKKFISGVNDIDMAHVSLDTFEGWQRCKSLRLDPLAKPVHTILKGKDLQKLLENNHELLDVSRPFLDHLYRFVKVSYFAVALFNADGYLLDVREETTISDVNQNINWYPGVLWSEPTAGNNTVSAVLRAQKPLQIFGPEHYNKNFHYVTASSAPIMSPAGKFLGGIILTAFYLGTNPHMLGVVVAAAQAIENELKAQKALAESRAAFTETEIAEGLRRAVISSIPEALIAIDMRSHVTIMNEKAQHKFLAHRQAPEGEPISKIFAGPENTALLKMIRQSESFTDVDMRIFSPSGPGDYTITCNPILTSTGKKIGKIIIFSESKRIQSLVNKVIGAKANYRFSDISGTNPQFKSAIEQAGIVSQGTSNVLILGESGTGKDILAQAIHNASPRRDGPYVAINCAAIPRDLIASELFGYSEGSFTGSKRGGNQGKFELADGGTIFLDEIAETPLELQAILLRVIEEKSIVRLGEGRVRPVDVRIISATNRDLIEEVRRGNFRKDLYYRLNVFAISIPPLRERTDDIPLLLETFVRKYSEALHKKITRIDKNIWSIFMHHNWPGNVRELQNVVERMINYAAGDELTCDLIPPEIRSSDEGRQKNGKLESPQEAEKKMIAYLLTLKFRKTQIADRLNMSRVTLFRKIKKYGLEELAHHDAPENANDDKPK